MNFPRLIRQSRFQPGRSMCRLLVVMCALALFAQTIEQPCLAQRISPSESFGRPTTGRTTTTVNFSPDEFAGILHQAGRQVALVAAKTSPSVVHIESERRTNKAITEETGSGVLVSDPRVDGVFIVTNRHVVADAELPDISILLSDQRVINPYEKIEDPSSDLAVLKVRDPGIATAHWGDSDNLDIGHFVLAMGSPFGLNQSVTLGIISAKGRRSLDLPGSRVINQDFLQTDAAINPGNSGGPLIDLNGRIVGINTAIASQGGGNEGIGFSIPSNLVQFVAIQLLEHGRVRRGYLGVELDEKFDLETARRFSLDRLFGARVTRVLDTTPAARAGLQRDDIIISFDGVDIEDENDLINRVSLTPVNKEVRMIVVRAGRKLALSVNLAERDTRQSALPEEMTPRFKPSVFRPSSSTNTRWSLPGLETRDLSPGLAQQLGFEANLQGVVVMQTLTPADDMAATDASTLQIYDVIEAVGRQPVQTAEQLSLQVESLKKQGNSEILLRVKRQIEGNPVTRLVILSL